MATAPSKFWQKHRGLVWSNLAADDAVHIRAALLRPRFSCLLDIALEFGPERLRDEWEKMVAEPTPEVKRARAPVERILKNIEKGRAIASTSN